MREEAIYLYATSAQQTSDHSYMIGGTTVSGGTPNQNIFIIITDSTSNTRNLI